MKLSEFKHLNFGGIYCIKNKLTNETYVGQATNVYRRIKTHLVESKKPRYNSELYKAIQRFGWINFDISILSKAFTAKDLNNLEAFWIFKLDSIHPKGYNSMIPYRRFNKLIKEGLPFRGHSSTTLTQPYI